MDRKYLYTLIAAVSIIIVFFGLQYKKNRQLSYFHDEGLIFGTVYSIKYQYTEDITGEIEAELKKADSTFSMFNTESIISGINRNDSTVVLTDHFITLFNRSQEIAGQTEGAFDITVAPLVNLWGFGFQKKDSVSPSIVADLLKTVGYKSIRLENNKIVKENPGTMLDASAIAKGYSCDLIADLIESKGITNYMIEIGGEMRTKGHNQRGECWTVGIRKPVERSDEEGEPLQQKIKLCEGALATSGNYRNFYYKDGKKYAHTIDPKTGYPVLHNLLSVSVITSDCMTADAYATAFMVMGMEKGRELLKEHPELHVYFIYSDEDGQLQTYYSSGFEQYLMND